MRLFRRRSSGLRLQGKPGQGSGSDSRLTRSRSGSAPEPQSAGVRTTGGLKTPKCDATAWEAQTAGSPRKTDSWNAEDIPGHLSPPDPTSAPCKHQRGLQEGAHQDENATRSGNTAMASFSAESPTVTPDPVGVGAETGQAELPFPVPRRSDASGATAPRPAREEQEEPEAPGKGGTATMSGNTSSSNGGKPPAKRISVVNWSHTRRPDIESRDLHTICIIGHGKFGTVLCVEHRTSHKQTKPGASSSASQQQEQPHAHEPPPQQFERYAVKFVERDRITREVDRKVIFRERDVMLAMSESAFVVPLINTFKSTRSLYLLMEYCPGLSLSTHIKRGVGLPSMDMITFYTANVMLALMHIHMSGYIHRDIKPGNLLLDKDGYIKVGDFGHSRRLEKGGRTKSVAGTYAYLAPEQCMHRSYDHSADVWSAGITCFHMGYGTTPFEANRNQEQEKFRKQTRQNIIFQEVDFPTTRDHSPEYKSFILAVLRKIPSNRLGVNMNFASIMNHAFFRNTDWDQISNRQTKPPFVPQDTTTQESSK